MLEPDWCGESGLSGIHMSVSAFLALSQILRVTTLLADIWPFSQRAATILDQVLGNADVLSLLLIARCAS